jgi:(p)ppGpp synthase/HD superfamily hydrolase
MWQLHQQDPELNLHKVADELIRDGLISVARTNMVDGVRKFEESIQKGGQVEAALDRVRPFHDRGRSFLVHKQECTEFARSMAQHDRAIAVEDVASFLTSASSHGKSVS